MIRHRGDYVDIWGLFHEQRLIEIIAWTSKYMDKFLGVELTIFLWHLQTLNKRSCGKRIDELLHAIVLC